MTTAAVSQPSRAGKWPLSRKIYFAAAVLLLLFLAMAIASYFGFNRVEQQFEKFAESSQIETELTEIDGDVARLQRKVTAFTITRNSTAAQSIRNQGRSLQTAIDDALSRNISAEAGDRLSTMRSHLDDYLENFETVVQERELRTKLVESEIIQGATQLNLTLEHLLDATPEADSAVGRSLRRAQAALSLAQASVLQFLSNPDAKLVRTALAELKTAASEVTEQLNQAEIQDEADFERIQQGVANFEKNFLRIVQATRGYLYLVNVVMAGDAAEFSFQAKQLKEDSQRELNQLRAQTLEETEQANQFNLGLTLVAVVLGMLIVTGLARNILGPILSITETFGDLLHGKQVDEIPGLERNDEIGDMARAADQLKVRTQETQRLLAESQRLAAELETQAAALAKSNEDLDSFAYVASHDLKSPLRAIDNVSKWIAEDAGDMLPKKSKEHLDVLRQRVGRMESLLDDLLAYSRAGRTNDLAGPVNVHRLVEEIPSLIDWPSDASLEIESTLPTIRGEETIFQRIFLNLITNAVKYRSKQPLRLRVTSKELHDAYEFSIADNGIGIAPEFHESIFKMFRRLHRQADIEGTGMGLSLVQKLVEAGGGRVWVESAEGEGATFRFTWPK